jgi:hypothetical protein
VKRRHAAAKNLAEALGICPNTNAGDNLPRCNAGIPLMDSHCGAETDRFSDGRYGFELIGFVRANEQVRADHIAAA